MWFDNKGNDMDVVLYSMADIVRNVKGFPFVPRMTSADYENVIDMVRQTTSGGEYNFARLDELDEAAKADMYYMGICGSQFLKENDHAAILLNKDNKSAIVVNDEEHLRITSLQAGSDFMEAYKAADNIALMLERQLEIAYSEKLGFLTSRIHSVGTGLHIGFVVCIPGVDKTTNMVNVIKDRLRKMDWTMESRSIPGVGFEQGVYVISNSTTLGLTEEELLKRATTIISDIINIEHKCRASLIKNRYSAIEDKYYRAYALLGNARKMDLLEAFEHISWLRLGHGYIKNDETNLDWDLINNLHYKVRRDYELLDTIKNKNSVGGFKRADKIRAIINN